MAGRLDQPMAFACASRSPLCRPEGISFIVLFLKALPVAELVLPLDDHAGHGVVFECSHPEQGRGLELIVRAKDKPDALRLRSWLLSAATS